MDATEKAIRAVPMAIIKYSFMIVRLFFFMSSNSFLSISTAQHINNTSLSAKPKSDILYSAQALLFYPK